LKDKYNILVTGCGGDIGQSIGKILKSNSLTKVVVGCDMSTQHPGKFIFNKVYQITSCRSNSYELEIKKIVKSDGIDLILPVSEPELRFFSENKVDQFFADVPLVSANLRAREIGFDKFVTVEFLKNLKLPYPKTFLIKELKEPQLPVILKSRNGSGGKSVLIIKEPNEFRFYKEKYPEFIAQELLSDENDEYTCCVFRSKENETRTIIYKRTLMGGYSNFGIVVQHEAIERVLMKIAGALQLNGSINVQLKLVKDVPYIFEINPRFSSTVRFRDMMGFKDLIWSIEDITGHGVSPYTKPLEGTKFYKGFNEYVD